MEYMFCKCAIKSGCMLIIFIYCLCTVMYCTKWLLILSVQKWELLYIDCNPRPYFYSSLCTANLGIDQCLSWRILDYRMTNLPVTSALTNPKCVTVRTQREGVSCSTSEKTYVVIQREHWGDSVCDSAHTGGLIMNRTCYYYSRHLGQLCLE